MKEQRKMGFMRSLMKLSFVLLVVGLTVGVSLPSAHAQRLLFYNSVDQSGADGHINQTGGFVTDHTYGAGSFGTWTHVVGRI